MALPLEGPLQRGRGVRGHYVYWLVMPMPTAATVARTGVKTPRDFDRTSFRDVCIEAHTFNGIDMAETVCFLEPHANGDPHLNLLGDLFLHSFRTPPQPPVAIPCSFSCAAAPEATSRIRNRMRGRPSSTTCPRHPFARQPSAQPPAATAYGARAALTAPLHSLLRVPPPARRNVAPSSETIPPCCHTPTPKQQQFFSASVHAVQVEASSRTPACSPQGPRQLRKQPAHLARRSGVRLRRF
jgi:hypothetical protein